MNIDHKPLNEQTLTKPVQTTGEDTMVTIDTQETTQTPAIQAKGALDQAKNDFFAKKRSLDTAQADLMANLPTAVVKVNTLSAPAETTEIERDEHLLEKLAPWPESVDGFELFVELIKILKTHTVMDEDSYVAVALWVMRTYLHDSFNVSPLLAISSPQKRCGKSTLLDLIFALAYRTKFTSNTSAAAFYYAIDQAQPTMVIDEMDSFAKSKEGLFNVMKASHVKGRAWVSRAVANPNGGYSEQPIRCWTPIAFASIGSTNELDQALADRSVTVQLQRKAAWQNVEPVGVDLFERMQPLRRKLLRFALDHEKAVAKAQIKPHSLGNDRAVDNWAPLFTIAKQIGPQALGWCQGAYESHHERNKAEEKDVETLLLEDLQWIFDQSDRDKMSSKELIDELKAMEERPWGYRVSGSEMNPRKLASMLAPFKVHPKQLTIFGQNQRGYALKDLQPVFDRYLDESV
jgi:hypothetical protein